MINHADSLDPLPRFELHVQPVIFAPVYGSGTPKMSPACRLAKVFCVQLGRDIPDAWIKPHLEPLHASPLFTTDKTGMIVSLQLELGVELFRYGELNVPDSDSAADCAASFSALKHLSLKTPLQLVLPFVPVDTLSSSSVSRIAQPVYGRSEDERSWTGAVSSQKFCTTNDWFRDWTAWR